MKNWDLHTGGAKLDAAMEKLKEAAVRSLDTWDDETNRQFQATHIDPLDAKVRKAMDAVNRLAEVLARAEQACASRHD